MDNEKEFYEKIEASFSESREGTVIVEKFVDGTEIQVDCIAIHGKAYICMMKDLSIVDANGRELQISGYQVPGEMCTAHANQIAEVAQKIAAAYHLDSGAFFYQGKCNSNGVFVIEAAARMAGGTTYDAASLCAGCDYMDMAIDGFMGKKINTIPHFSDRKFVGKFLHMKPGVFGSVTGLREMLEDNRLIRSWIFVKSGTTITESHISANRIASIMAECSDYEEGADKINRALDDIRILDIHGNDLSGWR